MSSFKPEVIADSSGEWSGNACRFATEDEAKAYVHDLFMRWTLVRETRVVPSDDDVNCKWEGGRAVFLDAAKAS
jgi:hypothetical protein